MTELPRPANEPRRLAATERERWGGQSVRRGIREPLREIPRRSAALVPPTPSAPVRSRLNGVLAAAVLLLGCVESPDATPLDALPGFRETVLPTTDGGRPAPRAVCVAPDGERLVLDTVGRVLVYGPDGAFRTSWWMPDHSVGRPEGIRKTADGRVYVADTHYHRVVEFDAAGTVTRMFGSRGEGPGQFEYPVAVELDDAGFLYVAEYGGHDRVQKFTLEGDYVMEFGSAGTGPGEFQRASGLVWRREDGRGVVYVSDAINQVVHRFGDDGAYLGRVGGDRPPPLAFPYDLAETPGGDFAVPDYSGGTVTVFGADGTVRGRYGGPGRGPGELWTPWGLALTTDGTVVVADTGNRRLVEFELPR